MLLNKVWDLDDLIEAHFFAATQKPSQQVCFQRGDRACGGIYTLLTYEQFFTLRHI